MNLLHVAPEKLEGVGEALGMQGHGVFHVPGVLDAQAVELVQEEIFDPFCVQWRDNHHDSDHPRWGRLVENHTVFALKLDRGKKSHEFRVPRLRQLREETVDFIRGLGTIFPSLVDFTPDEMSLHRYDDAEVGLSFHVDNLRFRKVVGVVRLEGEGEFQYLNRKLEKGEQPNEQDIEVVAAKAGDLILTRVSGLHELRRDERGKLINDCPDHRVVNQKTPFVTSFMVRENSIPDENPNGFTYENWSDDD